MKVLVSLFVCLISYTLVAQDNLHTFEATKINVNQNGQKIETSTADPSIVRVDLGAKTVTVETTSQEVRELLKDKMTLDIDKQMGKIGAQYSLQLDEFIFVHFYTDMQMIIFTRNDTHPLQWGIQFLEAQKVD